MDLLFFPMEGEKLRGEFDKGRGEGEKRRVSVEEVEGSGVGREV